MPEHSHTIQGAAHTTPNTLTDRTGAPLQRAAPVNQWMIPFDSLFTHTFNSHVFPSPSLSTLGFLQQSFGFGFFKNKKFIRVIQQQSQLNLGVSREGLQTKASLGNYTLMIYAPMPHVSCTGLFSSMVICGLGCSNIIRDSFFISTQAGH